MGERTDVKIFLNSPLEKTKKEMFGL